MTRDPDELERRLRLIEESCLNPGDQGCGTCVFFAEGFSKGAKHATDPGWCRRGIIGSKEGGWPSRQVGSWCGEYETHDVWAVRTEKRAEWLHESLADRERLKSSIPH